MNYRKVISGVNERREYFSLNKSPLFEGIVDSDFSNEQRKSFKNFKENFPKLFNLYFPANFSDYNNNVRIKILDFIWTESNFSEKECRTHYISSEYKVDLVWDIFWHCKKMQFKPASENIKQSLENWVKDSFKIGLFLLSEISEGIWEVKASRNNEHDFFSLKINVISYEEEGVILEFDCLRKKRLEFCNVPKINKQGSFIINGHEKIVVFQSVRSPGLYLFSNESGDKYIELIPFKGPWTSIYQDSIRIKKGENKLKPCYKLKFLNSGISVSFFNIFKSIGLELEKDIIEKLFSDDEKVYNSFIYGPEEEKKQFSSFLFSEDNSYFLIGELGRIKINRRLNIVSKMFGLELAQDIISLDSNEIILPKGSVLIGKNFEIFKEFLYSDKIEEFKIPQIGDHLSLYSFKVFSKNKNENDKVLTVLGWRDDKSKRYFDSIDLLCTISYFSNAIYGLNKFEKEEIKDRLDHQVIRRVGDLMQNIFDNKLGSFIKGISDKYIPYISQLKRADLLRIPGSKDFDSLIKGFFNSSTLVQLQNQNNPISEASYLRKVSVLGLGGLNSINASLTVRNTNPSFPGRYDSVETQEGTKTGLTHSVVLNARIDEFGQIRSSYYRVFDGEVLNELVYLTSEEEFNSFVSHCSININENNLIIDKKILAKHKDKFILINTNDLNYIDSSFYQLNSVNSASIPFFQHNDSTRMLMACNMQKQAVITLGNEPPLISSGTEETLLKNSPLTVICENNGIVVYADSRKVLVKEDDGFEKQYDIKQFFNSNKNSFFTSFVQVKSGEKVEKGQIISYGNYGKEGELSLGANLRVAFLTWNSIHAKAGGYEDSIIVSSKIANSGVLTSFYNTEYLIFRKNTKYGEEEFTKYHLKDNESLNLDGNGIIREGSRVNEGDILVGKVTPEPGKKGEAEQLLFSSIFGDKFSNLVNSSFRLPYGESGIVRSVERISAKEIGKVKKNISNSNYGNNDLEIVKINVSKFRNLEVGDKLTSRFGNKGVISKIVSEIDMPFDEYGNRIDIIFNPLSVPSRMNIGQLFEAILGLAAYKLNIKFLVKPFNTPSLEVIKNILNEANIKDHGLIKLYDGETGKQFSHKVLVGYIYTMKLNHMVSDKFHSKSTGPYSLIFQQPVKGKSQGGRQKIGEMETWSLQAYEAASFISEAFGCKSDDIWKRIEFNRNILFGEKEFEFRNNKSESTNLVINILRSLGMNVKIKDMNDKEVDVDKYFASLWLN